MWRWRQTVTFYCWVGVALIQSRLWVRTRTRNDHQLHWQTFAATVLSCGWCAFPWWCSLRTAAEGEWDHFRLLYVSLLLCLHIWPYMFHTLLSYQFISSVQREKFMSRTLFSKVWFFLYITLICSGFFFFHLMFFGFFFSFNAQLYFEV